MGTSTEKDKSRDPKLGNFVSEYGSQMQMEYSLRERNNRKGFSDPKETWGQA